MGNQLGFQQNMCILNHPGTSRKMLYPGWGSQAR